MSRSVVNRDDRNSRKASYDKIRRGFELGVENLLWFPEGVWNKSPNLLPVFTEIYAWHIGWYWKISQIPNM